MMPTPRPNFVTFAFVTLLTLARLVSSSHAQPSATFAAPLVVSSPRGSEQPGGSQNIAALDLAIAAVEAGFDELSAKAVRRACETSPVVGQRVELSGLLGSTPAPPKSLANDGAFARKLAQVDEAWRDANIDPALAYATWRDILLPPDEPSKMRRFSTAVQNSSNSWTGIDLAPKRPPSPIGGMAWLTYWAREAKQVEDLRQRVAARDNQATPPAELQSLALLLFEPTAPPDSLTALIKDSLGGSARFADAQGIERKLAAIWLALDAQPNNKAAREALFENVVANSTSLADYQQRRWLDYTYTRATKHALETGNRGRFRTCAALLMTRYDRLGGAVDTIAQWRSELYDNAARIAFAAGHTDLGFECVALRAKLPLGNQGSSLDTTALLDPQSPLTAHLFSASQRTRAEMLASFVWRLPKLGLADGSRLNVNDPTPEVVARSLQRAPLIRRHNLLHRMATPNARSLSLIEWTMREQLARKRTQVVRAKMRELRQRGSAEERIARIAFSLAKGEGIPLHEYANSDNPGGKRIEPLLGPAADLTALDIAALEAAVASDKYRSLARPFMDEALKRAKLGYKQLPVTWLRYLRHQARVADGERVTTHQALVHWHAAEDIPASARLAGHVAESMWLQRADDAWGHEYGTHRSYLLLKYPLQGSFTIRFQGRDDSYGEAGATLAGVDLDFLGYLQQVHASAMGERGSHTLSTPGLTQGRQFDVALRHEPGKVTVAVANSPEHVIELPPGTSIPFFGLSSHHVRATTISNLVIEGDISIPRQVDLLSPQLIGWTTTFSGDRLPDATLAVESADEAEAVEEKDPRQPHWLMEEGELRSGELQQPKPPPNPALDASSKFAGEALIQYLRPLGEGESIELECFFDKHPTSPHRVAPAVGRLAINLHGKVPTLHWVTLGDHGRATGILATNTIPLPNDQMPQPLQIKHDVWNKVRVTLERGELVLEVNGAEVMRRPWEPEAGRRFGLFHDPTSSRVRVRNVRLSGDWPTQLPAKLWETRAGEDD